MKKQARAIVTAWPFVLYGVSIILCAAGWLIPQGLPDEYYLQAYGPLFFRAGRAMGLFALFHSWPLAGMLAIVFVHLLVRLRQLPAGTLLTSHSITRAEIDAHEHRAHFSVRRELELVADRIKQVLRGGGFHVLEFQSGTEVYFWAEKHRLNRWGTYIMHVGILIALTGAILGGRFGFTEHITLVPGAQEAILARNMAVSLVSYEEERYAESTVPRLQQARIELFERGEYIARAMIGYTTPFAYEGVRFYLAGVDTVLYNARVEIGIGTHSRKKTRLLRLAFAAPVSVKGKRGWTAAVERFVPDYARDEQGRVYSQSTRWRNPAILVTVRQGETVLGSHWLFSRMKDFQESVLPAPPPYTIRLLELNPTDAVTLSVSLHPGLTGVWVGFGLLVIGMILRFYMINRRILVLAVQGQRTTDVAVAGETVRDRLYFQEYFTMVVSLLKKS